MPSKEIKELRQSGKLKEAFEMAKVELEATPDNIWAKRNMSWVYYEYLKANSSVDNYQVFIENLKSLKDLELPADDNMVVDNASFQIGKLIFSIQRMQHPDYAKINEVFDVIKNFHFTKSSVSYSFIYNAFHKGYKTWSRYIEFAEWWDFSNFISEDYKMQTLPNGREVMSIVEQAYIAYSKKLLEGEQNEFNQFERIIDKEKISEFMPKLDKVIEDYPTYQYPAYFKAKLLLAVGDKDNVLVSFMPFAKKKKNDFWVWELMSDIFEPEDERKLECLCKALSLKSKEEFLINARQKLAVLLIKSNSFNEAKTEIDKIVKTRKNQGWSVPGHITQWTNEPWYSKAVSQANNHSFYKNYIDTAEELLFEDVAQELVMVEFVNKDKKMLNFIKDKSLHGFFSYKNFKIKPNIGDLLNIRIEPIGNEGFYKVLTLKKADQSKTHECKAFKEVSGKIRITNGNKFGFLEDIFISPDIIEKQNIKDQDELACKAILSFNKKKKEWGWKCYEIV